MYKKEFTRSQNLGLSQRYCVLSVRHIFDGVSVQYFRFEENARVRLLNARQQKTFGLNWTTWNNYLKLI
jgi:hypothetical protein